MSNDIAITDDTTDATNANESVASNLARELATTAAGCVVALALTSGATLLVNKVRAFRANRSNDITDSSATAID